MPPAGIDQKSVTKSIVRLADEVVPPADQLRALREAGHSFIGVGLLRVRSRWDVDRDGTTRFGSAVTTRVDVSKLVEAAVSGATPPAELALQVQRAVEKASSVDGGGVYEVMFLPLVIPEAQVETAMGILREVFVALAGRSEVQP